MKTSMADASSDLRMRQCGQLGVIELNRPHALNALTLGMVRALTRQLRLWAHADEIAAIVLTGAGDKAFCAGGDVRALYDWGQQGAPEASDFYREEYQLNHMLKTSAKPVLALMHGVTMGGGAGLALPARWRFVGPGFRFAMPETGIGLFPDVGGSFYLSRLRGECGVWLALTGARLGAAEACALGLGTHYLTADGVAAFRAALEEGRDWQALADLAAPPPPASGEVLDEARSARCFGGAAVAEILAALKAEGSAWSEAQAQAMQRNSPLSSAVALRQIRLGAGLSFADCLRMEFRLAVRMMQQPDFYAGVRAVLLEKTGQPRWAHASHREVGEQLVDAIFAELGDKELHLEEGANET